MLCPLRIWSGHLQLPKSVLTRAACGGQPDHQAAHLSGFGWAWPMAYPWALCSVSPWDLCWVCARDRALELSLGLAWGYLTAFEWGLWWGPGSARSWGADTQTKEVSK
jgi:hypothetical protein